MHNRDAQLDAQLIEAAQGYVDSKRRSGWTSWMSGCMAIWSGTLW